MTQSEWEALPRDKQLAILRHMGVATVAAFPLSYQQLERILNGFFEGADCVLKCKRGERRCAACRFGWTRRHRRNESWRPD